MTLKEAIANRILQLCEERQITPYSLAMLCLSLIHIYAGVCLEGAIIALACIIFSVMAASPPAVDPNVSAVTAVWSYVGELIFNLLVLVGAVRMSDRIVKELLGL